MFKLLVLTFFIFSFSAFAKLSTETTPAKNKSADTKQAIEESCSMYCRRVLPLQFESCLANCRFLNGKNAQIINKNCEGCVPEFKMKLVSEAAACADTPAAFRNSVQEKLQYSISEKGAQEICGAYKAEQSNAPVRSVELKAKPNRKTETAN